MAARSYMAAAVSLAATVWLLVEARRVLEPLVISMLVWFLLNAGARAIGRLRGRPGRPGGLDRALSAAALLGLAVGLSVMASNSLAAFRANLPSYEANLRAMLGRLGAALGIEGPLDLGRMVEGINVADLALSLAGSALGFAGGLVLILIYVIFIFVEAANVEKKLRALAPDAGRFDALTGTILQIQSEIETYIGVKCVVGLAQALPTFVVLWLVGIDGAAFWAVAIFVASFVPTVGTLVGIAFPALVALVQFPSATPFVVTAALLAAIQIWGSNWLEPKMMGSSLNLSPLVILVAIFAGGAVWGITGALVAVPALSIAVIVFARLPQMRPVAILLTSDGRL